MKPGNVEKINKLGKFEDIIANPFTAQVEKEGDGLRFCKYGKPISAAYFDAGEVRILANNLAKIVDLLEE